MDRIVNGNYRCSVSGCLTTLKTKQENEHLFAIPQNISEDWRNVLRKPENWLPVAGAIPLPSFPTLFVASGKILYNE